MQNEVTKLNNVYPSIEELMPDSLLSIIPANLAKEIEERYRTLGDKYLTENTTEDGRRINGMMYTSRIDNGLEEIVDAVFCVLGWILKTSPKAAAHSTLYYTVPITPPDSAYTALTGLIEIYSLLKAEQASGAYS